MATLILGILGIDISAFSSALETYGAGLITRMYPNMGHLFWAHIHEPFVGFPVAAVLSSLYPACTAARKRPSEAIRYH